MHKRLLILACLLLPACQPPAVPPAPPPPTMSGRSDGVMNMVQAGSSALDAPRDARPNIPILFRLEVYILSLPMGTISQNEEVWKRINEQVVDIATYDLLYRNGIRIGEAPYTEWDHFRRMIESTPGVASQMSVAGAMAKNLEMPMRERIALQHIFYFDGKNELKGRTHTNSSNIITVSFQPAPRKPGQVRLALCPMVRSLRKRLEFTALNEEQEIRYIAPERLYDLNIEVDIPLQHFLVIAPSAEATWESSVGQRFFVKDDPAEQMEQVLLVIAQPYRLDSPDGGK
jgi:hypothetical protein